MADYTYQTDTKTHTRFSHLSRCTPNQIDALIAEIRGERGHAETESMGFGSVRHSMFQAESEVTGKIANCFGLDLPADFIEQEFITEIWPGIVIHSRPDVVSTNTVVDYKTVIDDVQGWRKIVDSYQHLSKKRQLIFYAYQLGLNGIKVDKGIFALEIWNKDRTEITGYETLEFKITMKDIVGVLAWVKPRVALLSAVMEEQE
jgi:hypothetical protein